MSQNYAPQQPGYYPYAAQQPPPGQYPPTQPGQVPLQPGQYPPPQPGQYPPPQQYPPPAAYYQGGYSAQASHVIVQQPAPQPVILAKVPASCQCPKCGATIVTKVEHRVGSTTMTYCLILSCFCCCCIPFCTDCAKDVVHKCPNCQSELGVFKQPLVDSGGGGGSRPKYDSTFHGPGDDGTGYGADDGGE